MHLIIWVNKRVTMIVWRVIINYNIKWGKFLNHADDLLFKKNDERIICTTINIQNLHKYFGDYRRC